MYTRSYAFLVLHPNEYTFERRVGQAAGGAGGWEAYRVVSVHMLPKLENLDAKVPLHSLYIYIYELFL